MGRIHFQKLEKEVLRREGCIVNDDGKEDVLEDNHDKEFEDLHLAT